MQNVKEQVRRPSPGSRPQPLAFDGTSLWMGSWDTDHIYQIDPTNGAVLQEVAAPGKPYGLAVLGNELRAVLSVGADDDRYFYRFSPGTGFDLASKTACPDLTGSHLASDGGLLYLAQMHYRRILIIGRDASIQREVPLPSPIGGMGFYSGTLYVISADDEFENLHFSTFNSHEEKPAITEVATIPFDARSLAFDGQVWWTSHREASQIVSFTV